MTAAEEARDIFFSCNGIEFAKTEAKDFTQVDGSFADGSLDEAIGDFVRRHEHSFMSA